MLLPRLASIAVRAGAAQAFGAASAVLHAAPTLGPFASHSTLFLSSNSIASPPAFARLFPSSWHGLAFATAASEPSPRPNQEPEVVLHAGLKAQQAAKEYAFDLAYTPSYAENVKPVHRPPVKLYEKIGYRVVRFARRAFDIATGYKHEVPQTEAQWLRRLLFLETVAGVPGMVAGVLRHLMSLRTMKKDHGWIMTMLEEAENERMHLLTFMELRQPGLFFRLMVILTQGVYFNVYFISYMISPKFCHSLVGYLEEEAVLTYTHCIEDIDKGTLPWKNKPAPQMAIDYWKLPKDADMRALVVAVRADEACHSYVNHRLSELKNDADNPFAGSHMGTDPAERIKDDRKS